jgi:excisionase family DNA binding protein
MSVQDVPTVLTVDEVADAMKVSRSTVRRMVVDGRLESFHFGRAVRVPLAALSVAQKNDHARKEVLMGSKIPSVEELPKAAPAGQPTTAPSHPNPAPPPQNPPGNA